jgi:hypothetical protein
LVQVHYFIILSIEEKKTVLETQPFKPITTIAEEEEKA